MIGGGGRRGGGGVGMKPMECELGNDWVDVSGGGGGRGMEMMGLGW